MALTAVKVLLILSVTSQQKGSANVYSRMNYGENGFAGMIDVEHGLSREKRIQEQTKQDGWLPPAYFLPPNFLQMLFKKMKAVFFSKKTLCSSNFLFFPIKKILVFFREKPHK